MKHCPFCHKIVWFWQSKAYLDARKKKPCHAYCWVWEMTTLQLDKDSAMIGMILQERIKWRSDDIDELQRLLKDGVLKEGDWKLYESEKEVKKVQDDTWQRGLEK